MALKREVTAKIKELLRQNPRGLNITEIVRRIDINRNTAGRYLENLMVAGQVEMHHFGMAKIYRLAQRVPLSAMLSISSELIMLLDSSMRIVYANEPMARFLGTTQEDLYGKNIEYTPFLTVFDPAFDLLKKQIRTGLAGSEWSGELPLPKKGAIFFSRIAPAVFEEGQRGVSVLLEDITDRKSAERRIQESERQFRQLAEQSLDMIHRQTPDDICIYISPACKTILGYDPEELIGRPVSWVLHPDDVPVVPAYKHTLSQKNRTAKISYRVRHRDGHYVWLESLLRAVFDKKSQKLVEIYGVTRDITEQKQAEEALRESEDRYRKLVEISPDAFILHQEGKIVYMNPAAYDLIGAAQSGDLIGKNILDLVHPDFRDTVSENIERDLVGEKTPPMELQMLRTDGTMVNVEGRGVRTFAGGRPAVQVTLRDITESKKAEQALRESEATARALINAPTDSILLLDAQGKILELNETAALRIGKRKDELIGALADTVLPEDIAQVRRSIISQVLERESVVRFEDERNGIWFDTVAYPITGEDGRVTRIAIIARDITDRKRVEAALRGSEAQYRSLAEASQDLIFVVDRDDIITYVNSYAAVMLGQEPSAVTGKMRASLFPHDIAKRQAEGLRRVFASRQPVRSIGPMQVGEEVRWFDHFLVPILDTDGRVTSVLGVSRDITELKRAEEEGPWTLS
jgi:PAS domain S-box-containing protein